MPIFRHGDIISSEIPSNWAELLGESNTELEMTAKPQLEFDFMKKTPEGIIQLRNGAERFEEEVSVIIGIVRDALPNISEELE